MQLLSLLAFENLTPFNWDTIQHALNFLWQGLLAIFVVIGLIVVAVKLTSLAIAKASEWKKQQAQKQQEETPLE